MLDSNLNPESATDVVVILGHVPVGPVCLNELLPSLKVAIKLRSGESMGVLSRLTPSANGFTNGVQVILRQGELKSER